MKMLGISYQPLQPSHSHGASVTMETMQEFPRTMLWGHSLRLFMKCLYSEIACASWLFGTLSTFFFFIEIVSNRFSCKPTKDHNVPEV